MAVIDSHFLYCTIDNEPYDYPDDARNRDIDGKSKGQNQNPEIQHDRAGKPKTLSII